MDRELQKGGFVFSGTTPSPVHVSTLIPNPVFGIEEAQAYSPAPNLPEVSSLPQFHPGHPHQGKSKITFVFSRGITKSKYYLQEYIFTLMLIPTTLPDSTRYIQVTHQMM